VKQSSYRQASESPLDYH